ncbi:TetR/AcrR family transcriptional regulator [Roseovarius pelagicus]|uniref:TetR family transcriptional regulator C-terminal domain-containing protein n=1 Tax=Roseovarius pelagicus TaxID=2980108 RepID=A0ABY6D5Z1_9RHOB|nr:TetR family transcriptional regulator C-terminal domain-containing protein [Roseovarius pelagicus]UXX81518.1 TetR family transcriptional regulator C-terminal domain-containing protein [Roseovarius pelagicus]
MSTTRTRTKNLPPEERKKQIIIAALTCLGRDGHAKLTARKLAKEAQTSLGNITYHFTDMREILVETYRYASRRLLEASESSLGTSDLSAQERLRTFLEAGFSEEFLDKGYTAMRIDLWSAALHYDEVRHVERELYQGYRDQLSNLIAAVRAECSDGFGNHISLVDVIMATLDGLWLDWMRREDNLSVRAALDLCMQLALAPPLTPEGGN